MKFDKLKLLVFDFDGVFTDNRVIVNERGEEAAICNRSDGIGLSRLRSLNIEMMILSTEVNPIVVHRAAKLKLPVIHKCNDKKLKMQEIAIEKNLDLSEIAFVGNDLNDIGALSIVGYPICVQDAYPEVKQVCKLILNRDGGFGAVRELCDLIFNQKTH